MIYRESHAMNQTAYRSTRRRRKPVPNQFRGTTDVTSLALDLLRQPFQRINESSDYPKPAHQSRNHKHTQPIISSFVVVVVDGTFDRTRVEVDAGRPRWQSAVTGVMTRLVEIPRIATGYIARSRAAL